MLFHPTNPTRSPEHERIYALYAVIYTCVDFAAALLFVVGSVLFFWEASQTVATWMFVIGSLCFALKPTIRLYTEIRLMRLGDYADVPKAGK